MQKIFFSAIVIVMLLAWWYPQQQLVRLEKVDWEKRYEQFHRPYNPAILTPSMALRRDNMRRDLHGLPLDEFITTSMR